MEWIKTLNDEYLPPNILFRENEINVIKRKIKSVLEGNKTSLLVYGNKGVGKSLVMRYITKHAEIKKVYVNALQYNSDFSLIEGILNYLGVIEPLKGKSKAELWELLFRIKSPLLIIIDEGDAVSLDFYRTLIKVGREKKPGGFFVIVVTNARPYFSSIIELFDAFIEFKPYSLNQLKEILKQRCPICRDEVIEKCAAFGFKYGGNARMALNLLRETYEIAFFNGETLSFEHVEKAKQLVIASEIRKVKNKIRENSLPLYEFMFSHGFVDYKSLQEWSEKQGIAERTVRKYLSEFIKKGLVEKKIVYINGKRSIFYRVVI